MKQKINSSNVIYKIISIYSSFVALSTYTPLVWSSAVDTADVWRLVLYQQNSHGIVYNTRLPLVSTIGTRHIFGASAVEWQGMERQGHYYCLARVLPPVRIKIGKLLMKRSIEFVNLFRGLCKSDESWQFFFFFSTVLVIDGRNFIVKLMKLRVN